MRLPPIKAALLLLAAAPAAAHDYRAGSLAIEHPVIRVSSPAAKTGAGYLAITNTGNTGDRLIRIETAGAARSDLHATTSNAAGIMRMRAIEAGIAIAPGERVTLAPGGMHIMFIGLRQPLPKGAALDATLHFLRAGKVQVSFAAQDMSTAP